MLKKVISAKPERAQAIQTVAYPMTKEIDCELYTWEEHVRALAVQKLLLTNSVGQSHSQEWVYLISYV